MGKNKQQVATEARAKKPSPDTAAQTAEAERTREGSDNPAAIQSKMDAVAAQPKPEVRPAAAPAPAAAAQPSKQLQTIAKLKEGWTAKGVDLDKLTIKDDGKFKLVVVGEGWPTCTIGPTGGIAVTELKSYAKERDAVMEGLGPYEKQKSRDQKKTATAAPTQQAAAKTPDTDKKMQ